VPMALRRPCARLKRDLANPEVGQSRCRSEAAVPAAGNLLIERRRITGAVHLLDIVEVDLGHPMLLCYAALMADPVDPIALARALINCPSVTPARGEVFDILDEALTGLGFTVHRWVTGEAPDGPTENMVAIRGSGP